MPHLHPRLRAVIPLLRAGLAGSAATVADVAVLALLVSVLDVPARIANVPALLCGAVVNFIGNRYFAFRATEGSLARQAIGYGVVEIVALGLNGLLFDLAMRALPVAYCVPIRLATSNLVFLFFSYPLWRMVFRVPARREAV